MAQLFRALADPTRAKIVHALVHADMTTSGLAALLGMSLPAISQHLRLLRMLRVVRSRRESRLVYYSLDDSHIRFLVTLTLTHLEEAHADPHHD
jgi:ArsR family transcriptional regulator